MRRLDDGAAGRRPAGWDLSDAAREFGALGMLNASRQCPDLTHLVLFAGPATRGARDVAGTRPVLAGAPIPFSF